MPDLTCTICSAPLCGIPDDDVCPDCAAANFPPPQDLLPLPWWLEARLPLAPRRSREETPHDATSP